MFLQKVKVKKFAESTKMYGVPPWSKGHYKAGYRGLELTDNPQPEEVYTVIGVTSIKEGESEYDSEAGYYFVQKNSHKVYLVAKSIGRRFKVLESDLELIND